MTGPKAPSPPVPLRRSGRLCRAAAGLGSAGRRGPRVPLHGASPQLPFLVRLELSVTSLPGASVSPVSQPRGVITARVSPCRVFAPVVCLILCKFSLIVQIIEERCEPLKVAGSTGEGTDISCGIKGFQRGSCQAVTQGEPRVMTGAHISTWLQLGALLAPWVGCLLLLPPNKAV